MKHEANVAGVVDTVEGRLNIQFCCEYANVDAWILAQESCCSDCIDEVV